VTEVRLMLTLISQDRATGICLALTFTGQSDGGSPCSGFTRQSDRDSPWHRERPCIAFLGDLVWLRHARLGVKQGNKLPFDNIDPLDCRESATRTEQGSGLLTIPVLVAGGQFGQANLQSRVSVHLPDKPQI